MEKAIISTTERFDEDYPKVEVIATIEANNTENIASLAKFIISEEVKAYLRNLGYDEEYINLMLNGEDADFHITCNDDKVFSFVDTLGNNGVKVSFQLVDLLACNK